MGFYGDLNEPNGNFQYIAMQQIPRGYLRENMGLIIFARLFFISTCLVSPRGVRPFQSIFLPREKLMVNSEGLTNGTKKRVLNRCVGY